MSSDSSADLTLVVASLDGVVVRRVVRASALPSDVQGAERGKAVEHALLGAAATWGLPDFMFTSPTERAGTSIVEIGDGLLIVGDRGVVLQSKSRTSAGSNDVRERSWLQKAVKKAVAQARGTVRRLLQPGDLRLTSQRGTDAVFETSTIHWVSVVLVDHDALPPGWVPEVADGAEGVVVMMRRDWEFLFEHLRSAAAVIDYVHRVAGEMIELGHEPNRYFEFALADDSAQNDPLDARLETMRGRSAAVSTPRAPIGAADDGAAADTFYRVLLEEVAQFAYADPEWQRHWILSELDRLPVATRHELAETLQTFWSELPEREADGVTVRFRTYTPNPGAFNPLVFGVAKAEAADVQELLLDRTTLHHIEYGDSIGSLAHTTVGVLLTPSRHANRVWDTSIYAVQGETGLDEAAADQLRVAFGR